MGPTWPERPRPSGAAPYLESHLDAPGGPLPGTASLLSVTGPFEVTALKRSERGDGLVLRMVNLSPRGASATLMVAPQLGIRRAFLTDLNESRQGELPLKGNRVTVRARRREIVTVELTGE